METGVLKAGANVSDITGAEAPLPLVPANGVLQYAKATTVTMYKARGPLPNIPPRKTRKWENCFSPYLYRGRNVI